MRPTDAEWLKERFQVAAEKRYHQLEKASEEQIPGKNPHPPDFAKGPWLA